MMAAAGLNTIRNEPHSSHDLIGGPFAVVESDPGVFTSIIRRLGVRGIEVEEVYSIESWATDHLKCRAKGLIFCFPHQRNFHPKSDFRDPCAKDLWFANQLCDDACATQAILNVLMNTENVYLGGVLQEFRADTIELDSIMKGLAIANNSAFRQAQNAVARPSDFRASLANIATQTLKPMTARPTKKRKRHAKVNDDLESYHFIGYVPSAGKVWELDGLKEGPLEVGEIGTTGEHWIDIVRPVLRVKMTHYGGTEEAAATDIRFNLLAVVDDMYEAKSDDLELLKRRKAALERRMATCWEDKVDPGLKTVASMIPRPLPSQTFSPSFGARAMEAQKFILDMDDAQLPQEWEKVVREGIYIQTSLQDEMERGMRMHTEEQKRTFDYEPFIQQYLTCLKEEGLVDSLLSLDDEAKTSRKTLKPNGKDKGKKS